MMTWEWGGKVVLALSCVYACPHIKRKKVLVQQNIISVTIKLIKSINFCKEIVVIDIYLFSIFCFLRYFISLLFLFLGKEENHLFYYMFKQFMGWNICCRVCCVQRRLCIILKQTCLQYWVVTMALINYVCLTCLLILYSFIILLLLPLFWSWLFIYFHLS